MVKILSLRAFFILVLLTSLTIRYYSIHAKNVQSDNYDISDAIADVVTLNGLTLLKNPVLPPKVLSSVVYFERPECSGPSLAMPFVLYRDGMTTLRRLNKPEYVNRFYFLDMTWTTWTTPNRFALILEWIKNSAQSFVGTTQYLPVKRAIAVAEPQNCADVNSTDWRMVWHKTRLGGLDNTQETSVMLSGLIPE